MDVLKPYFGPFLTVVAVGVALFGAKRKDKDKRPLRGLTGWGWFALLMAVFGFVLACYEIRQEQNREKLTTIAKYQARFYAYISINNSLHNLMHSFKSMISHTSNDRIRFNRMQLNRLKDAVVQVNSIHHELLEDDCRSFLSSLVSHEIHSERFDSNGVGNVHRQHFESYIELCNDFSSWLHERTPTELESLEQLTLLTTDVSSIRTTWDGP